MENTYLDIEKLEKQFLDLGFSKIDVEKIVNELKTDSFIIPYYYVELDELLSYFEKIVILTQKQREIHDDPYYICFNEISPIWKDMLDFYNKSSLSGDKIRNFFALSSIANIIHMVENNTHELSEKDFSDITNDIDWLIPFTRKRLRKITHDIPYEV